MIYSNKFYNCKGKIQEFITDDDIIEFWMQCPNGVQTGEANSSFYSIQDDSTA